MKNSEIKELTVREIEEKLDIERGELHRLHMNHSVSPLENPIKLRERRKTIARLLTEQTKRSNQEKK